MKKTIQWYEKKGKGSYFDPRLRRFTNEHFQLSEIAEQITDTEIVNPINLIDSGIQNVPEKQNPTLGWWIPIPVEVLKKKMILDVELTTEDLKPLNRIMTKKEAITIWEEIIEKKLKK